MWSSIQRSMIRWLKDVVANNIERIGDGLFKAKMPFTDDEYSYNMLLGFGANVKCTAPDFVRKKLLDTARGIISLYS